MSYSPAAVGYPDPISLSTMTLDVVDALSVISSSSTSSAQAANRAQFYPVRLGQRHTYITAWWVNGTAVAGNVQVGIYTLSAGSLTRVIASTPEAQAGTSALQVAAAFGPVTLDPGLYYLAISSNNAATTFFRPTVANTAGSRLLGMLTAESQYPLGTPITPATAAASFGVMCFGFSELSVI